MQSLQRHERARELMISECSWPWLACWLACIWLAVHVRQRDRSEVNRRIEALAVGQLELDRGATKDKGKGVSNANVRCVQK